jgi:hypothetical protein
MICFGFSRRPSLQRGLLAVLWAALGCRAPEATLYASSSVAGAAPDGAPADAASPMYGFWGLNGFVSPEGFVDVQRRLGANGLMVAHSGREHAVQTLLPMARAAGWRVTLRMIDEHQPQTARGDFDLDRWKAQVGRWRGTGVQEFIDDGTLAYHMLIDDLPNFAGRSPTGDELDEMARYSKSLMPGLKVAVREEAIALPVPSSGRYEHVDACINQYVSNDGDVEVFARDNAQLAESMGLELFNGLNIANGGDGSSGQPGWSEGRWAMSAQEIVTYGEALTASPDLVMFLAWEYDGEELWSDGSIGSDYFDQPENTEALRYLALRLAGEEVDPP